MARNDDEGSAGDHHPPAQAQVRDLAPSAELVDEGPGDPEQLGGLAGAEHEALVVVGPVNVHGVLLSVVASHFP